MRWGVVLPVVGGALLAAGAGMLVCALVAAGYGDGGGLAFALPGSATAALGAAGLLLGRRLPSSPLRPRDGYFAVTAAWAASAAAGAIPLLAAATFAAPVDAFFESMSGFTGCGATLLDDVEAEPHAVLLWRSLMHWIGGVGIVLLVVAVAPATGLASQRLFFAESSSPTTERLTPRIADTAKIIWGVYLTLTVASCLALFAAGMRPFDAVNHAFAGIATGGFSTRTASIGAFDSLPIELVTIVVMALGGINMAFYWRAVHGDSLRPQLAEVRAYVLLLAGGTAVVAASVLIADDVSGVGAALRESAFSVVSMMTTTAFITGDFDAYNDFARLVIVSLTFIGACAGSTAGGMKVVRFLLLSRTAVQEVQRQLQPSAVQVLRLPGRVFAEDVRRTVLGFFFVYVSVWALGMLVMAAAGLDAVTAGSASAAALNLSGAGLEAVGATENFGAVPPGGRAAMSLLMLIGRLEVFTVVALLTPAFWRRRWT